MGHEGVYITRKCFPDDYKGRDGVGHPESDESKSNKENDNILKHRRCSFFLCLLASFHLLMVQCFGDSRAVLDLS